MSLARLNALFVALLLLGLGSVSVLSYLLVRVQDQSLQDQRGRIILSLASELMVPDLKSGLRGEAYRKCKAIHLKHSLSYIEVMVVPDEVVCRFGEKSSKSSKRAIHFGDEDTAQLGSIEIAFSNDPTQAATLTPQLLLLLMMLLVMAGSAWTVSRLTQKHFSRPLLHFHKILGRENQDQTLAALGRARFRIEEMDGLRISMLDAFTRARRSQELESKVRLSEAKASIAAQVAHDIRSPLAALNMAERDLWALPEDTRLMARSAIGRIQDIANDLLAKNRASTDEAHPRSDGQIDFERHADSQKSRPEGSDGRAAGIDSVDMDVLLSSLLDMVVTEKRLQYRNRSFVRIESAGSASAYGIFVNVRASELKRVISNLINNSVEALSDDGGTVTVTLSRAASAPEMACLTIEDNGRGIPSDVLARMGQQGFTFGKDGGNGLGFHHARQFIESLGGEIHVESTLGLGTRVELRLPTLPPPDWFVPELRVNAEESICVLDDDAAIHQVWRGRFESAGVSLSRLMHFSDGRTFSDWHSQNPQEQERTLFLFDFELLQQTETGLDLVEKHGLNNRAVLVTSRFEELPLRSRCARLGVRLIPKGMAAFVPIRPQQGAGQNQNGVC